ncbi:hypothetical protein [Bombilactobacillus thymidiniphilus]|uniref:Uncharacterized protein n=1 Tax=Bombilactobacillus thymidiniphilus TaxID=2923363 RepID=A0ABY4PC49_9LACO|nr:hypothetical protein [Bombilactobacillus thymidiniphilus]UQS83267.1 hypothetical protein MOO47_05685 [Bombilactobacillus thymidiniphilus]
MDYRQLLSDLIDGKIDKIEIDEQSFFAFNQAWKECTKRKQIIGTAGRGGHVIYRFSESDNK